MKIRLLPMSKIEFATKEEVINFLMDELPANDGYYYYRRRSIVYEEDIIVAFQYDGHIVASAVLVGQSSDGKIENGVEYKGAYIFNPESFKEYSSPITAADIKSLMPAFKNFNQSTQYLDDVCISLLR